MKVRISEKHQLNIKESGFDLVKLSVVKEGERAGEINESFVGYWPKLDQAVSHIVTRELHEEGGACDVVGLHKKLDEVCNRIVEAIEGCK